MKTSAPSGSVGNFPQTFAGWAVLTILFAAVTALAVMLVSPTPAQSPGGETATVGPRSEKMNSERPGLFNRGHLRTIDHAVTYREAGRSMTSKSRLLISTSLWWFVISGTVCAVVTAVLVASKQDLNTVRGLVNTIINTIVFGLAGGVFNGICCALIMTRKIICPSCGLLRGRTCVPCPKCNYRPPAAQV